VGVSVDVWLNLARKCPYADGKAAIVRIFGELGELVDRKLEMAVFDELARTNIGPVTLCSLGFIFSLNPGAQLHKSMSQICSLWVKYRGLPLICFFLSLFQGMLGVIYDDDTVGPLELNMDLKKDLTVDVKQLDKKKEAIGRIEEYLEG